MAIKPLRPVLAPQSERSCHVEKARCLAPLIEGDANRIETDGKLTSGVVDALQAQGLFAVGVPESAGGSGGSVIDMIEVLEELARADGSTGWVTMVYWIGVLLHAGYLPLESSTELFLTGKPTPRFAGAAAPTGTGVKIEGGYLISGTWPFSSGSDWATWLGLGFLVTDREGKPIQGPDGKPQALYAVTPRESGVISRNWDVTGLKGTGSHDIVVKEAFIPDAYIIDAYSTAPVRKDPVFYLGKDLSAWAGHSAVTLGLMKRALQEVATIATGKVRRGYPTTVDQYPVFDFEFAKADAKYRSARAYLIAIYKEAIEQAKRDGAVGNETRARAHQAAVWVHRVADEVVSFARLWAASQAFRNPSNLGRVIRDAEVATLHLHIDNIHLVTSGQTLVECAWQELQQSMNPA